MTVSGEPVAARAQLAPDHEQTECQRQQHKNCRNGICFAYRCWRAGDGLLFLYGDFRLCRHKQESPE